LRCLELLLEASTARLYSHISADDFQATDQPLVSEAALVDFTDVEKALFPDEVYVGSDINTSRLVIRPPATADENETVLIGHSAPEGGTGRQLSRGRQLGLGWKLWSATVQTRDLRDDRKSALGVALRTVDLGDEKAAFEGITKSLAYQRLVLCRKHEIHPVLHQAFSGNED
jgi:putative ATP-dependent endonuclease of OLD family